ncbi:MAG: ABC transporter permease subunit [Pseudomonadota bacterium]
MSTGSPRSPATASISLSRRVTDRLATALVGAAGATIIGLILLILAYLLYSALPLSRGAAIGARDAQPLSRSPAVFSALNGSRWLMETEASSQVSGESQRLTRSAGQGAVLVDPFRLNVFFLGGGSTAEAPTASSDSTADETQRARLLDTIPFEDTQVNGRMTAAQRAVHVDEWDGQLLVSFVNAKSRIEILARSVSGADAGLSAQRWELPGPATTVQSLLLDASRMQIFAVRGGVIARYYLEKDALRQENAEFGVTPNLLKLGWGPRRETLLTVDEQQRVLRFDLARPAMRLLGEPRPVPFEVSALGSERDRRVSYASGPQGQVALFVPTVDGFLLERTLAGATNNDPVTLSQDGSWFLQTQGDALVRWRVLNEYPETGWRSLWLSASYSAQDAPAYSWQPDGAAIGVLSKFSLTPLLLGTLKAAVYGMLVAVPLAFGAAIYTGFFLVPRQRNRIKPIIELLEAFPTVVLGFIAGLWLAPRLADNLLFVLAAPLLLIGVPLLASAVQRRFSHPSHRIPRFRLLILSYLLSLYALFLFAPNLESLFFDGPLRDWLWLRFSIPYDQLNALLVGLAMGIAITPAMFSICEDAIFAVPRALSDGSLALGATRWQALYRVVLPAASPALLSAALIGLSRGFGETMIVLLATGNSPLMDLSPFSSLRSISATIAIELPEAAAASTNFRLLFLAALVLFALTFLMNTVAEIYRQRLRYAYSRS